MQQSPLCQHPPRRSLSHATVARRQRSLRWTTLVLLAACIDAQILPPAIRPPFLNRPTAPSQVAEPTFAPITPTTRRPTPQTPGGTPAPASQPVGPDEVPAPTSRPTAPTSRPSDLPSGTPSTEPSGQPSSAPSLRPSRSPSLAPSGQPSEYPSRTPSLMPSGAPSATVSAQPSQSPSLQPSDGPSLVPSGGPSGMPTQAPTGTTSVSPSSMPSDEPSNQPSGEPSIPPSSEPTPETPPPTVSHKPTGQPSLAPSLRPSDIPTRGPSILPSEGPSPFPSVAPSQAPSLGFQEDIVEVVMLLTETKGEMPTGALIDYESVTGAHVEQAIKSFNAGAEEPLLSLKVNANIRSQLPIPDTPMNTTTRRLQSLLPLQVRVDIKVEYQSTKRDYDESEWIGEAFNSDDDREAYLTRLKQTNSFFDTVEMVQLLVDGVTPVEEQLETPSSNDMSIWIIVGAACGGLVAAVALGALLARRFSGGSDPSKNGGQTSSNTKTGVSMHTEIVMDRQDDISTLGDPYIGMNTGNSVRDERTASVGDDYDYARQYLASQGIDPDARSRLPSADDVSAPTRQSSTTSAQMSKGPLSQSVFSDDASLEQVFESGHGQGSQADRFEVTVPAGKLGMVIDTPHGGVPVVHAIKSESVLASHVHVGDVLLAVDGDDVTEMTAVQVSKLISLKSGQKRVLTFRSGHRVAS